MSEVGTYAWAREQLDDHVWKLRLAVEKNVETMVQAAWAKFAEGETTADDTAVRGLVQAYRESAHRQIFIAWQSGIAALVGLVLPRRPVGKRRAVSTRNRRAKGTGKRKPFPSDSHKRAPYKRSKGHRARYRDRWLGTFIKVGGKAKGLPKLARLAAPLPGRPEVPAAHRVWRKKVASCKRLSRARARTAEARHAKGWKQYPRHRKSIVPPKGWSDPSVNRNGGLVMTQLVAKIRKGNLDVLRERSRKQRKIWEDAH